MIPENDLLERELEGTDRLARKVAEKYRKKSSVKLLHDRQSDFILQFLAGQRVERVLDVGCGIGSFLVQAQAQYDHVSGVDPSRESLEIARKFLPRADLRAGVGEHLPFGNDEMDAVVMKGVVHHLPDPTLVFREVHRCLKPGGIVVIFEGNRSSPYRRMVLGLADLLEYDHESTLFEHRSADVMKQMSTGAGLEPFSCRNISGLFAPVALFGVGGQLFWRVAFGIEDLLQRTVPWCFNYYVLLAARKGPADGSSSGLIATRS